jgi:hypothetical protein
MGLFPDANGQHGAALERLAFAVTAAVTRRSTHFSDGLHSLQTVQTVRKLRSRSFPRQGQKRRNGNNCV